MLVYFGLILICFILSLFKLSKPLENTALVLIAIFMCFGYMTGTDWYSYEQFYTNELLTQKMSGKIEVGYFFIQNLSKQLGLDFWTFHIIVKLLVFFSLINFIRHFNVNVFLFLALFIPEAGLYLFIDCPFRNLIAIGFSLLAFTKLFDNKTVLFFVYVVLALLFHLSAIVMILVFFVYKKDMRTIFVLISAFIIYTLAFNVDFLIKHVYIPLTKISPLIEERLDMYLTSSKFIANKVNIGTFIRLFVLLILLLYKENIVSGDKKRSYIFNLAMLFLLIYPFGISMKILQRFLFYFIPFYVLNIIYLLKSFQIKTNKYLIGLFFVLLSFAQTYNTVTADFRYVPYTNYLEYYFKGNFPDKEYRYQYNRKHSPYR